MDWSMDQTRYTGRPQTGPGRDPGEMACYDFLDGLGVSYDRVDHDPAFHIETCHQVEAVLGAPIAKNLFLCNRQKTQFYLLLMEGDKVFKTKHLSAQLGCSRLSFADEGDLNRLLGVQPGSASLLCLLQDRESLVQLVLDPAFAGASVSGAAPLPEHLHLAHCHGRRAGAGDSRPGSHPCPGRPAGGGPVKPVGRFAPTPSGRMHLGNLFSALLAWLSIRSQGGELVLRMEDLDPQRTRGRLCRAAPPGPRLAGAHLGPGDRAPKPPLRRLPGRLPAAGSPRTPVSLLLHP